MFARWSNEDLTDLSQFCVFLTSMKLCSRVSVVMTTVHQGSFIEFQCYIDTNNAKYFTQLDGFISSLGMNYIFPQISLGTEVLLFQYEYIVISWLS